MRQLAAVLLAMAAVLAGCGGPSDETPAACLGRPAAYLHALAAAPAPVRLAGGVQISDCLAQNQKAGDLATVGMAIVEAATRLNAAGRTEPGGEAPLRVGYLVGAAQHGADRTSGIHADLMRRLRAAALYSPGGRPLPDGFQSAYRRGLQAGESRG